MTAQRVMGKTKGLNAPPNLIKQVRNDLVSLGLLQIVRGYGQGQVLEIDDDNVLAAALNIDLVLFYTDEEPTEPVGRVYGLSRFMNEQNADHVRDWLRMLGLLDDVDGTSRDKTYRFNEERTRKLYSDLMKII